MTTVLRCCGGEGVEGCWLKIEDEGGDGFFRVRYIPDMTMINLQKIFYLF